VTPSAGPVAAADLERFLAGALPAGATVRVTREARRRLVVCATREPHCLGELLLGASCGDLPVTIAAVVANHDDLRTLVERFDIPFHLVSHDGLSREAHEGALVAAVAAHAPETVVLARYMRVLSSAAIAALPPRMINIHHSFLPAFAGASPYRQAFDRGVKLIGATAHFVTEELDAGPIIAQDVIPVSHADTPAGMARAGRDLEKLVLARAVRLVAEERVFIHGRRTVVFG